MLRLKPCYEHHSLDLGFDIQHSVNICDYYSEGFEENFWLLKKYLFYLERFPRKSFECMPTSALKWLKIQLPEVWVRGECEEASGSSGGLPEVLHCKLECVSMETWNNE